ncbi:hypothetical protein [Microcella sp.]|uniref:hypothetical protein n=1 Tax=Microcella sp. TaxID=1913979 RepID=UPI00391A4B95
MALSALGGWLITAGAVAVSGVAGASIALSGVLAAPQPLDPGIGGLIESTAAHACVDGPVVSELFAGDRVLVVAQSDDADWVAVRNPQRLTELLWVPATVIVIDDGEAAAVGAVPIGGQCASVTIVADSAPPAAEPVASEPPVDDSDGSPSPSQPARDRTAPTISSVVSQHPIVACDDGYTYPTATVITITAADAVGVTGVRATWSGAYTGQATATRSGSVWVFTFDATGPGTQGPVQFTITAVDAAGNVSAPAGLTVPVDCLI